MANNYDAKGDWSQPLAGRCFRSPDGAVTLADYDFNPCSPDHEHVGVLCISHDGILQGTTIGGHQLRHELADGRLVEITRAEFDARRAVAARWQDWEGPR